MLSRVSAALSQFIKPIISAPERLVVVHSSQPEPQSRKEASEFKRFEKKKEGQDQPGENPKPPGAKILPFRTPEPVTSKAEPVPPGAGITHSFVQLFSALQQPRTAFLRWIGSASYQAAVKNERKVGKYRKGAMLDRKVE
ncbi:MAG: hypothetical protein NDJ90_15795 [Oligoflexia bacterium]|nr:hypothetical protein [Oligoflexia bacterium]